jgi:diacylglycerol kinase family enzyme
VPRPLRASLARVPSTPPSADASTAPIPAFVNPASGSASAALAALRADARFAVHEMAPDGLAEALRAAAAGGARRVLVAGGDGTVAVGAAAAAETGLELAVLPGGTLNHFARDLGLPTDDLAACVEVAAVGLARPADLGWVNGRPILNTSSIGVYVSFVRARERLERWLGYGVASALAAVRVWVGVRGFRAFVVADPDGPGGSPPRRYRTSLVFVGVDERELGRDGPGARTPGGRRALHLLVVRETTRARLAALAWSALVRGLDTAARTDAFDALLVDACTVELRRPWGRVAIDGELVRMKAPLRYTIARDAFTVVAPHPADDARTA